MISWNEGEPKYDIHEWSPDHERRGKGVTLSTEELSTLKEVLNNIEMTVT